MLNLAPAPGSLGPLLHEQLQGVSAVFEAQLASDLPPVNRLCAHIERYRGKMLRPSLVMLSGLAAAGEPCDGSRLTQKHRILGAVTEMIHMATLVHDDVLDEADVRRGGSTVNSLWGNESAVILGDYLISNAFHLCSTMGDPSINLALGAVTNTLCEGELVQLHHRHDHSLEEEMYLEIVRRKTASLIGECCRLGALLAGAREDVGTAMRTFGERLGIAFQIQDDLLDLVGEQDVVGKSLGRDLDKGKVTLPVIYALAGDQAQPSADLDRRASGSEQPENRAQIVHMIERADHAGLRRLLIDEGCVERASERALGFVESAKAELLALPESRARDLLAVLADRVVAREC